MILRLASLPSSRVLSLCRLPPSARHLSSTLPSSAVGSRRDVSRGTRHSRVTKPRAREAPTQLQPSDEPPPATPHTSPPSPPWPTTSSPGGATFPWNGYNDGPNPPAPAGVTAPAAVEVTPDERPPIEALPVVVPRDELGVLDNSKGEWSDKARALFSVSAIVVVRYQLLSPSGELLGYLMEEDLGLRSAITRQVLKTHRAFKATVLSVDGDVILRIKRPFSWINSRIYISTPSGNEASADVKGRRNSCSGNLGTRANPRSPTDVEIEGDIIGEAQQDFHLWRRKYNHFVKRDGEFVQFGETDSGLLSWDFWIRDSSGATIGSINRNFAGFGRELFTDTGQYVLRFEGVVDELLNPAIASPPVPDALPSPTGPASADASHTTKSSDTGLASTSNGDSDISSVPATIPLPSITFDQRAVMLASAVSIDFDYFTRSRGGLGGGMMWMPMPMGGTGTTDAGVAGAEGGAVGGAVGGALGDEPLPSAGSSEDDGFGGVSSGGDESYSSGEWTETPMEDGEVMVDPWAQSPSQEDGGTWSWGDLFPDD